MRSGAWTFYEATPIEDIMIAVKHLNEISESELCRMIEKGIHDYQNPLYNDEYPEEWMKADFLNALVFVNETEI